MTQALNAIDPEWWQRLNLNLKVGSRSCRSVKTAYDAILWKQMQFIFSATSFFPCSVFLLTSESRPCLFQMGVRGEGGGREAVGRGCGGGGRWWEGTAYAVQRNKGGQKSTADRHNCLGVPWAYTAFLPLCQAELAQRALVEVSTAGLPGCVYNTAGCRRPSLGTQQFHRRMLY